MIKRILCLILGHYPRLVPHDLARLQALYEKETGEKWVYHCIHCGKELES